MKRIVIATAIIAMSPRNPGSSLVIAAINLGRTKISAIVKSAPPIITSVVIFFPNENNTPRIAMTDITLAIENCLFLAGVDSFTYFMDFHSSLEASFRTRKNHEHQ